MLDTTSVVADSADPFRRFDEPDGATHAGADDVAAAEGSGMLGHDDIVG
jgi:hypothetical protein